ncbi:unnamed protein product [Sphagnum troendelagicum]|uniref:Uncharacterized protein n=1 Tax=Sphagnum troendelagicum TaxID=128251 RepID=A0ABP0UYD1_9BRYO
MAIGTSVSSPMHEQSSYPDYYFEATYKLSKDAHRICHRYGVGRGTWDQRRQERASNGGCWCQGIGPGLTMDALVLLRSVTFIS